MAGIYSWCVWGEGYRSWLPKTDVVIFGKGESPDAMERVAVQWEHVLEICGHYLQSTTEDPPRFKVDVFPNADEWRKLQAIGEAIG
jgi:hypothetical protein